MEGQQRRRHDQEQVFNVLPPEDEVDEDNVQHQQSFSYENDDEDEGFIF